MGLSTLIWKARDELLAIGCYTGKKRGKLNKYTTDSITIFPRFWPFFRQQKPQQVIQQSFLPVFLPKQGTAINAENTDALIAESPIKKPGIWPRAACFLMPQAVHYHTAADVSYSTLPWLISFQQHQVLFFHTLSKIAGCGIGPKNVADWISAETLVETLFSFLLLLEWADVLLLFLDGWDLGIILEFVAGILQCHSHANEMWSNVICCMLTCGWFSERIWWHVSTRLPTPYKIFLVTLFMFQL